ncbi:hypothetical protein LJR066_005722 [Acidovorax sp. LjRoot66]|uniref:phage regulatory CII family protein n=1 Tax=Acidovorax sp. LjRoot66 TaxID=3342334 RepID=UPI003ECEA62D
MSGAVPTGGLPARFPTCLDCVRVCAHESGQHHYTIAKSMGISPSDLSRKLASKPNDCRRFTLNDLEAYMQSTQDFTPVLYLVQKYIPDLATGDRAAATAALRAAVPQLKALLKAAGVAE